MASKIGCMRCQSCFVITDFTFGSKFVECAGCHVKYEIEYEDLTNHEDIQDTICHFHQVVSEEKK